MLSAMEGSEKPSFPPPYAHPSSPPATPGSHARPRFSANIIHSSPNFQRMGLSVLAQSPPAEHIQPTGEGHQFFYTRSQQIRDLSSRPSSASGVPSQISPADSILEEGPCKEVPTIQPRKVEHADFVLEELADGDGSYDSQTEVIRPDHTEEATSEAAIDGRTEVESGIVNELRRLWRAKDSDEEEERPRNYPKKKKRWSAGLYKRSHSQSMGSDTDNDDSEALDAHDMGSSARRLRRRVRGPGDRSSLIFEDIPRTHIVEVEEPDELSLDMSEAAPQMGGHESAPLEALPFWVLEDPMVIDSDDDRPVSRS